MANNTPNDLEEIHTNLSRISQIRLDSSQQCKRTFNVIRFLTHAIFTRFNISTATNTNILSGKSQVHAMKERNNTNIIEKYPLLLPVLNLINFISDRLLGCDNLSENEKKYLENIKETILLFSETISFYIDIKEQEKVIKDTEKLVREFKITDPARYRRIQQAEDQQVREGTLRPEHRLTEPTNEVHTRAAAGVGVGAGAGSDPNYDPVVGFGGHKKRKSKKRVNKKSKARMTKQKRKFKGVVRNVRISSRGKKYVLLKGKKHYL